MTQTNMSDKGGRKPNRIPVRFEDEGAAPEAGARGGEGLTPDELGRESSYDDATEMARRIESGEGGETGSGESGAVGSTDISEQPRSRNDQDTTASHADPEGEGGGGASGTSPEPQRRADGGAAGPQMVELIATRAELKRVEGELKRLADERQDLTDKLARRSADFDNFRKRTDRERAETYQRALGEVVRRLLPVLDNLQRALDAQHVFEVKESEEFRHFLHGVELINRQLGGVLEGLGLEVVTTVGERFDPHVHEAVATEETDEFEPDTVTQEMQRGYRLGDKLLRPAMVKVATKP